MRSVEIFYDHDEDEQKLTMRVFLDGSIVNETVATASDCGGVYAMTLGLLEDLTGDGRHEA
jgi:hypothetical protein